MLNITSLKSSKTFTNAIVVDAHRAQISTVFKSREVCKSNQSKPVKHTDRTRQFKLSVAAINEKNKFLCFLETETWPVEKNFLRENVMRSPILDSAINENQWKADILQALIDTYKRNFPASAQQHVACYARNIEIDSENPAHTTCSSPERSGSGPICENENNQHGSHEGQNDKITNSESLDEEWDISDPSISDCSPCTENLQENIGVNPQFETVDDNLPSKQVITRIPPLKYLRVKLLHRLKLTKAINQWHLLLTTTHPNPHALMDLN